jgi:hypothetical protein
MRSSPEFAADGPPQIGSRIPSASRPRTGEIYTDRGTAMSADYRGCARKARQSRNSKASIFSTPIARVDQVYTGWTGSSTTILAIGLETGENQWTSRAINIACRIRPLGILASTISSCSLHRYVCPKHFLVVITRGRLRTSGSKLPKRLEVPAADRTMALFRSTWNCR